MPTEHSKAGRQPEPGTAGRSIVSREHIASEKIIATPTSLAWAQVYNAGTLFLALSLVHKVHDGKEKSVLSAAGKELLNNIEAEYFSLETKGMAAIKKALMDAIAGLPADVSLSLAAASLHKDSAFVFAMDGGTITIQRGGNTGVVLAAKPDDSTLLSATGPLEHNDMFALQTGQFTDLIDQKEVGASLLHATIQEAAALFAKKLADKEEPGAACVLLEYSAPSGTEVEKVVESRVETPSTPPQQEEVESTSSPLPAMLRNAMQAGQSPLSPHISLPKLSFLRLSQKQKVILGCAGLLLLILIASIFFTLSTQGNAKRQALFQNAMDGAQKKYEEGTGIASMNKSLAKDDFLAAEKTVKDAQKQMPTDSKEYKDLGMLRKQIEDALAGASSEFAVTVKQASLSESPLLEAVSKQSSVKGYTQDDKAVYVLTNDAVFKGDSRLFKNEGDWTAPVGLGVFGSNVYILDKKANQIFKFSPFERGYDKVKYLATDGIDLSKAQALTNDTSVYVVFSDGTLAKFTRGKPDTFSIKDLDKPLNNPKGIFTNQDTDNLYVLDSGNARLVVLGKDGSYKAQYQVDQAKTTTAFDVQEKNKKAFFLSSGKVYGIDLK